MSLIRSFVHANAFMPREPLKGKFLDGFSRETVRIVHDISTYGFPSKGKAALPTI